MTKVQLQGMVAQLGSPGTMAEGKVRLQAFEAELERYPGSPDPEFDRLARYVLEENISQQRLTNVLRAYCASKLGGPTKT